MVTTLIARIVAIRLVRFAIVGLLCLSLQYLIVEVLYTQFSLGAFVADVIGFGVSAQLNFLLSNQFSWGDAERVSGSALFHRWLNFLGVAALATLMNAGVYALVRRHTDGLAAIVCAAVVSTIWTFLLNHYFVFQPTQGEFNSEQVTTE